VCMHAHMGLHICMCLCVQGVKLNTEPRCTASLTALILPHIMYIYNLLHVRVGAGNYLQLCEATETLGNCILNLL
jgi:hypothetical protein